MCINIIINITRNTKTTLAIFLKCNNTFNTQDPSRVRCFSKRGHNRSPMAENTLKSLKMTFSMRKQAPKGYYYLVA